MKFMYKTICEPAILKAFDFNFVLLFALAVVIVFVAFHTPELKIVREMTKEELKHTEFKAS